MTETPASRARAPRDARSTRAWFAGFVAVGAVAACNAVYGIDELRYGPPADGVGHGAQAGSATGGVSGAAGSGGRGGDGGVGASTTSTTSSATTTGTTTTSTTTPLPSCQETYGSIGAEFELCGESEAQCFFYVTSTAAGFDCATACQQGGGQCESVGDAPGDPCLLGQEQPCTWESNILHCICTRGCGDGPPCDYPHVCLDGGCQ